MAGGERETPDDRRELRYLAAVLGLLVCLLLTAFAMQRYSAWQGDDFPEFYAAGKLSGTGALYDYPSLRAIEEQYHAGVFALPFLRLPVVAWVLKPLAALPYRTARIVWFAAASLAAILMVLLWPGGRLDTRLALAAWFLPITNCILGGQDDVFFTLLGVVAARWLTQRCDSLGGFAIGSAFFKPHLGIGLAVFLLAARRWRAAVWAGIAASIQIGLSFLAEGWRWLQAYSQALQSPVADIGGGHQPNLRGLASYLPAGQTYAEIILAVAALTTLWMASRRLDCVSGVALALAIGLLVGHHAYIYDVTLAYPMLVTAWTASRAARIFTIPLLIPALYSLPYLANLNNTAFVISEAGIVGALIGIVVCIIRPALAQRVSPLLPA